MIGDSPDDDVSAEPYTYIVNDHGTTVPVSLYAPLCIPFDVMLTSQSGSNTHGRHGHVHVLLGLHACYHVIWVCTIVNVNMALHIHGKMSL